MSEAEFRERLARIEARRRADRAARGLDPDKRDAAPAARPQGFPEGFSVPRPEDQPRQPVGRAIRKGFMIGGLFGASGRWAAILTHDESGGALERADALWAMAQDQSAGVGPMLVLVGAVGSGLFALLAPLHGWTSLGWRGGALVAYLGAFALALVVAAAFAAMALGVMEIQTLVPIS